ncbi:hypothetical protein [Xanthomonas sacchari]|uniref:hypothetical protein n=1 Tax=Xanthomonas sacchari TaxID=56458 RepID=UPI002256B217|nr:hypothetical protein [Xanthomonas sacchari]MCW0370246.1 hypothetical protein [Xanthomonas sacchari]
MTPRDYWSKYVNKKGGPKAVADHLGIPYSSIAGICNGSRGIGRALARRMAKADRSLDVRILVWVQAEKPLEGEAA